MRDPNQALGPGLSNPVIEFSGGTGSGTVCLVGGDPRARAASPSVAAVIQADVLTEAHCQIRGVEDYSLVFSSARSA